MKNMTSSLFSGTDVREDGAQRRPASPDTAGRHERELIGPLIALGGLSPSGRSVGRSVPGSVGLPDKSGVGGG